MSIALPWLRRKEFFQFTRPPVIVFGVGLWVPLRRYIGPCFRVFSIQPKPTVETWLCIRFNCLRRTFGLANATVDTFVGVNNKHVFSLIEAIDGTNFNAIQVFALDTILDHNVSHIAILATILSSIGEG
jgi:hypothetical protein